MGLAISAGVLIGGLVPHVLRTGRIDALDWLLPGFAGLLLMLVMLPDSLRVRACWQGWALVALPPGLFVMLAGSGIAAIGLLALAGMLALSAGLLAAARRPGTRPAIRWLVLLLWVALLGGGRWAVERRESAGFGPAPTEAGLITALPDQAGGASGSLWLTALTARQPVRVMGGIDDGGLAGLRVLLLAQPRQLRAEERVALDRWVRDGGLAVILADPLLLWPDSRPFGDPQRAPLTSLLDPLLARWGLALEPARIGEAGPVERRLLAGGALVQFAAAARFTAAPGSPCRLAEQGLVARCRIGRGAARLVADADWLDDRLWTRDPAHPNDSRAWTSDAIPMLAHLLRRNEEAFAPGWRWLADGQSMVSALRAALGLALGLALALLAIPALPRFARISGDRSRKPPGEPHRDPDLG